MKCSECGSRRIVEVDIIHHLRCSEQAPANLFIHNRLLICPKCKAELNERDHDYDISGSARICVVCGAVS